MQAFGVLAPPLLQGAEARGQAGARLLGPRLRHPHGNEEHPHGERHDDDGEGGGETAGERFEKRGQGEQGSRGEVEQQSEGRKGEEVHGASHQSE